MSMIDLSTVTAPQVVEALDFEAIFAQLKAELLARLPGVADVLELESEPLTKLLQVAAYREAAKRIRRMAYLRKGAQRVPCLDLEA